MTRGELKVSNIGTLIKAIPSHSAFKHKWFCAICAVSPCPWTQTGLFYFSLFICFCMWNLTSETNSEFRPLQDFRNVQIVWSCRLRCTILEDSKLLGGVNIRLWREAVESPLIWCYEGHAKMSQFLESRKPWISICNWVAGFLNTHPRRFHQCGSKHIRARFQDVPSAWGTAFTNCCQRPVANSFQ